MDLHAATSQAITQRRMALRSNNAGQTFHYNDVPVFAEWDRNQGARLVSFPIASELALIVVSGGQLNRCRTQDDVVVINGQTMAHARDFVIGCKTTFPGDQYLPRA
jgi:hypothetical protein